MTDLQPHPIGRQDKIFSYGTRAWILNVFKLKALDTS